MSEPTITITLTIPELMDLPGDAVLKLLAKAAPPKDFLQLCHDHEWRPLRGKGRWVISNGIREMTTKTQA